MDALSFPVRYTPSFITRLHKTLGDVIHLLYTVYIFNVI